MKKTILTIAVLLIAAYSADAQLTYGIKTGLNFAGVTKVEESRTKVGIYVGGFAEYRINDFVAISPELVYSRQGSSASKDALDVADLDKSKLRLNYINMPILAKIYVLDELSVDLGPQIGFLINAKRWTKDGDNVSKDDLGDYVKGLDVSFGIGATYNFGQCFAQARYNVGLTKVYDDGNHKNSVFQLGVGYRF